MAKTPQVLTIIDDVVDGPIKKISIADAEEFLSEMGRRFGNGSITVEIEGPFDEGHGRVIAFLERLRS